MPDAASLADEIKQEMGIEPRLIAGAGGVFEVTADGQIIYQKAETGRFPDRGEIVRLLKSRSK